MARGGSSSKRRTEADEARERARLKDLAMRCNLVSRAPPRCSSPLAPSSQVAKHHGADIIRKSNRKTRFLFSLPGLFAPLSGGNIGHLEHLGSKNPVLYLHFPQGRMKLFGTIFYPKNRYLTLQFSRGGKNVICEDSFDNMIVFSEASWIGRKEENPTEAMLEFPKELTEGSHTDVDFKGGAGAVAPNVKENLNSGSKHIKNGTMEVDSEDDISDDERITENKMKVTPIRHSERNARKKFNFAENPIESDPDENFGDFEGEEKVTVKSDSVTGIGSNGMKKACLLVPPQSSSATNGSLVQTSLSTLFKKAEEKKASRNMKRYAKSKASKQTLQHIGRKKYVEIEEDKQEDENSSSPSQESDGSDEDWTA